MATTAKLEKEDLAAVQGILHSRRPGDNRNDFYETAAAYEGQLNRQSPSQAYQFYQQQELNARALGHGGISAYWHSQAMGVQPLGQGQQSALDLMNQTLTSWGLSSLSGALRNLIVKGDTNSDTLTLALSQTPEWKQRFSGNEERLKKGLAPLSPAQYLAAEESYKQVLQAYGMPKGFYDTQSALAKFIGNDISAAELDARAKDAHDTYTAAPQYMKDLWGQYFGTKGDAIAGILDPKTATQVINDRATQVQIGGAAAAQGLHINQARAEQFQQAGVTQAQAQKAYSQIAGSMPIDQQIASRFHQTFGQTQEENDLLLGQGQAALQRQTLYNDEQGLFQGHAGANAESIGVSQAR